MSTSIPYPVQSNQYQPTQPPAMHWAIILALDVVTFSLFGYFWAYRQASFIKKIDPTNPTSQRATFQVLVSLLLALTSGLLAGINSVTISRGGVGTDLSLVMNVIHLFQFALFAVASVVVQRALVSCYGVKMNMFLTILFNIFYVQYHMTRIAKLQLPLLAQQRGSSQVPGHIAPTQI